MRSGTRRFLTLVVAMAAAVTPALAVHGVADAATPTVDGQFAGLGVLPGGSSVNLTVVGRGAVPATGVGAVALNVTATNPSASSYLTVWPAGAAKPTASNLNVVPGQTVPNMVIVPVGTNGQISIYNNAGTVDVVVDVLGWFPMGSGYTGLTPARLLDTRAAPTIDGQFQGAGAVGQAGSTDLTVVGRGNVPATGVGAVALNVTATNPTAPSYLTVWPAGAAKPTASNLNVVPGQTVPNMVIVPVGADGKISIYNNAGSVDVIADVLGWFPAGNSYHGLTPARLMDSRAGLSTIDGQFLGTGPIGSGGSTNLTVVGRGSVPATGVGAVALNVTAAGPTIAGYLTAWPAGAPRPTASNLNFVPGQTVPNMVIVPVGASGQISLFNNAGNVHVVVDVLGWFPAGNAYTGLTPARLMDTRTAPAAAAGAARNLLLVRPALHQMAGADRVAVWVCEPPANSAQPIYADPGDGTNRVPADPAAIAAWAQQNVTPFFAVESVARYVPSFFAAGRIPLSVTDGPTECLARAVAATGRPFTNVLATDTATYGGGFGSAGLIGPSDASNLDRLSVPPAESRRGVWVGGGATAGSRLAPVVVDHELGHSVHWPHSYTGPDTAYDNPTDMMSEMPQSASCERSFGGGGTERWPCNPLNTMAFNRFAAGWIEEGQVALHQSGSETLTLDAPMAEGLQFAAAPDPANPKVMLTLEARPKVGYDSGLDIEGVALYVVDQRANECRRAISGACLSAARRQAPALGQPHGSQSIVPVGSTVTVYGITVSVTGRTGNAFTVQVSGTFAAPAQLPIADDGGV